MPDHVAVIGPPGTGKTESLTMTARGWLRSGVEPDRVAYLAFGKKAAEEAKLRVLDDGFGDELDEKLPYFRTIHSLAWMGVRKQFSDANPMLEGDMRRFSKATGLEGAFAVPHWEDLAEVYATLENNGKTDWDRCLSAYNLSRISSRTVEDLQAAKSGFSRPAAHVVGCLEKDVYCSFVRQYEAYKKGNGLFDFPDMIEFALTEMQPLDDVEYVVVDEFQDVAPLLDLVISRIFRNSRQVWYGADEDQAIFTFAAADPQIFIDKAKAARWRIFLRETRRFGQDIVDYSSQIIGRVRNRIPKEVFGVEGKQHTIRKTGEFKPEAADMLVLHRHVAGCQKVGRAYFDAGLPYRNERGRDPLGAHARVEAYETMNDLASGKEVTISAASRLIMDLMPSTIVSEQNQQIRLIPHGAKKKFQDVGKSMVDLRELLMAKFLTSEGYEAIALKSFRVFKHAEDLEYYERVIQNGHSLSGSGVPVVTTIHASKGRQGKKVLVFSERGRKCALEEDAEHRLAYVAVTRTQGDLEICDDRLVEWAELPYEYPQADQKKEEVLI